MRRPRFRLRSLMLLIMAAGLLVWADRARRHCSECREMAELFASAEQDLLDNPDPGRSICGTYYISMTQEEKDREAAEWRAGAPARRAARRREAEYYGRGKRIFERAAWRPWEAFPDYSLDFDDPVESAAASL